MKGPHPVLRVFLLTTWLWGGTGLLYAAELAELEQRAYAHLQQTPPDWGAARAAFKVAADAGSSRAMAYLGWIFETGQGVEINGEKAAYWYAEAARAGALDYAVKLGWMYLSGDAVPADREQAEYWFGMAIEQEHVPAKLALASVIIADALGGRDIDRIYESRALLEQVLEAGDLTAAFFLARLYIEGIGGHPTDAEKAAYYTRLGAESGHAQMQGWLAQMYLQGAGVPQDDIEAGKWALLAAAGGDLLGQQLNAVLDAELSDSDKEQVVTRAMSWMRDRQNAANR